MNGPNACGIKEVLLQLDNPLRFRLSRIKEINDTEKMNRTPNKYIRTLNSSKQYCVPFLTYHCH